MRNARAKAAVAPKPPEPKPTPPPPPTPEQMPAQPPQVSYLNGQLTIISQNSTLADILSAVRNRTGAVIEVPPGAATERVAGSMGPGPARDVLANLLNGSRFDYVMIASPASPTGVQRVILTPRSGPVSSGAPGNTTVANNQVQQQPQQVNDVPEVPPEVEEQEMPTADEQQEENADAPPAAMQQDQQQFPQQGTVQPGLSPNIPQVYPGQQPDQQGQPGAAGQPGVKTPEQLLQELQRMQQQQQQQQQQQPQEPPQQ